jgi:hypothetical protein
MMVMRLSSLGVPDTGFSTDGEMSMNLATPDWALGTSTAANGTITIFGRTGNDPDPEVGVYRVLTNGDPDTTFSTDGMIQLPAAVGPVASGGVALPNGSVLVADTDNGDIRIRRLLPDGNADTSFDGDGSLTVDVAGIDNAFGIAQGDLSRDGRIAVVGSANNNSDLAVIQLGSTILEDYDDALGHDWANTAQSHFGACVRSVGAGTTPTWAPGTCDDVDGTMWNGISPSPEKVAVADPDTTTARVNFRFGAYIADNETAGNYYAPILFSVIAPNVP